MGRWILEFDKSIHMNSYQSKQERRMIFMKEK
jgi:hypothetical protein